MKNSQVILAGARSACPPQHFELREVDVSERAKVNADPGQPLVRRPGMRGWANDVPNYSPPVELGTPMRSLAVGEVIASRHSDYSEGDVVEGMLGWQSHALSDGSNIGHKVMETDLPRTYALGILGLNGTTAYFGVMDTLSAKAGDTVVVSTAAGAVGSAVGQIAKILGCRTVGIAGGPENPAVSRRFGAAPPSLQIRRCGCAAVACRMAWIAISTTPAVDF